MELQFYTFSSTAIVQIKQMSKMHNAICARRVSHVECRAFKKMRLRLGTDPAGDAATIASVLRGRKRYAGVLYLLVAQTDLEALKNADYLTKLGKAFRHCTRHSLGDVFFVFLIPWSEPSPL